MGMSLSDLLNNGHPPERRGRTKGSPNEDQGLTKLERKVVHMRLAEATQDVIAFMCELSQASVEQILKRPRVRQYMRLLDAEAAETAGEVVANVTKAIEEKAARAFEVECQVMEQLMAIEPEKEGVLVKARLGAAATAQDILDRAGKRAPTKILERREFAIADDTVEKLGRIVGDVQSRRMIDVTPSEAEGEDAGS